jgi:CMP-N,N'-diacetyllegionaminic acid synthase
MNKNIVLIPARSGSKRIKNKNLKVCGGKPLIYWTLKAAQNAKNINEIYVSTDSNKIANFCKKEGAIIPFIRPRKLSNSKTEMLDVLKHFNQYLIESNIKCDSITLLQPTSPLRKPSDIDRCINIYYEVKPDSVVTVCSLKDIVKPKTIMYPKEKSKLASNLFTELALKNKELNKKLFFRNGPAIIVIRPSNLSKNTIFGKKISYSMMPIERSVDIDIDYDFFLANLLLSR